MPLNATQRERILILGNSQTPEMEPVCHSVHECFQNAQVVYASSLAALSEDTDCPALVIVCQNWPDEFPSGTLTELIKRFAVSRFLCCYGVWCESDGRTRHHWPLSIRVPARAAGVRIQQEKEIIQGNTPALPLTAGRDEICLHETESAVLRFESSQIPPRIRVISADRAYREMLAAQVTAWGGQVVPSAEPQKSDLWLFDLDPWETVQSQILFQTDLPPIVGMMGLAHPESVTAARSCGVEAVVCKLAPAWELFQAINRVRNLKVFPGEGHRSSGL